MTVIDPNTGLMITCEPWEYDELCKQRGWIKTVYETSTTPVQKYSFTPPEEKAELEWAKRAKLCGEINCEPVKEMDGWRRDE